MKCVFRKILSASTAAAVAVCAFSSSAFAEAKYAHYGPVLLSDISIIDGLGNDVSQGQDLLIENGKIAAIGKAGEVSAPSDVMRIDGSGKTVMPGLIDMHTHTLGGWANGTVPGAEFAPSYVSSEVRRTLLAHLYSGVTTVQDMGASHLWVVNMRDRVNNEDILGPRMFVVGAPITQGPTGWGGLNPSIITDYSNIPDYLDEYERDDIKMIKLYRGISVQVARRVIEQAHARGMKTVADLWSMNLDGLWMKATDLDGWAHLGGPSILPSSIFDMMKEDSRFIITTASLGETLAGSRLTEDTDKSFLSNPLVVDIYGRKEIEKYYANLDAGREYFYDGEDSFYQSQGFGEMTRYHTNFMANLKLAYDAGVFLAGGTDAPYLGLFVGEGMHRELELMVEAGIPPLDAIKISSHNGAKLLDIHEVTGSLQVGMDADLIIVNGNPATNISNTRNIEYVFKMGKMIDREAIKIE
jgi:imidazolonepropionase-like amidohydrolase